MVLADRRNTPKVTRTIMELEEQTSYGTALVGDLMKEQLRSALILVLVTAVGLGGLPLLFWMVPEVRDAEPGGVPLPWLLLGVLPYPFLILVGYLGTRVAECHEREFLDRLER